MHKSFLLFALVGMAWAQKYGTGRAATPAEIAARDYSVSARGAGLPAGGGTAKEGQALYEKHCATCHGPEMKGDGEQGYPALAGGVGTLGSAKPVRTVGSYWPYAAGVFDYVRRAMPYDNPHSLKVDEYYAITAYVLFVNGIVKQDERLDAKTLPAVKMPNRDGFFPDPRVSGKSPKY